VSLEQPAIGRHVPVLDGIRGLAVLVVFVNNVGYFDEPVDSLPLKAIRLVFGAGWIGVHLFFVLSGFLITGVLLDTRSDPHRLRSFYVRRALRIFPLYFLALAVAFVVLPAFIDLGAWGERARHVQVWYWTFLMNWTDTFTGTLPGLSHLWSLAIEVQFYVLWPLAVFGLTPRALTRLCVGLVVSALVIRIGLVLLNVPGSATFDVTVARWDGLAWGAALAMALRTTEWREGFAAGLRRAAWPACFLLLVVAMADRSLSWTSPMGQTAGTSLVALLFAFVVLSAVGDHADGRWAQALAASGTLRFFAKYGYAMYILHWPIHQLGQTKLSHWVIIGTATSRPLHLLAYVAGNLIVTTALAVAVYHLVERPFLSLKDRLAPLRRL
jgi:peptidoglycan/LPS O-acetylase OafA/YrhL